MNEHLVATRGDSAGPWHGNPASNLIRFPTRRLLGAAIDEREVGHTRPRWLRRFGPKEAGRAGRKADGDLDAPTGLPDRLSFMDHLAGAIDRSKRNPAHHFAVLLLELDRPDRPGDDGDAPACDCALTAAARRLEARLRAEERGAGENPTHLLARLRGDELAILLDGLEEVADARAVADQILAETIASCTVGGRERFLSPSIGIAVSATGYTRAEDVLRDADTALYRARLLGRGRAEVFDTAALRSVQAERQLETDLREALSRGEFLLYFQPVVCLASNRIVGFEALVRWQHPSRGLVSPEEFIPIAEKTGLIVPLGKWIVREACLQLKAWQERLDAAKDVWVSVNLSASQFTHPGLVDAIGEALRDVDLPARSLVLELTEGVAMENPAAVEDMLTRLRRMGARIALDDFGTGPSSLSCLHQYPAELLKLDRSFVRDLETRKDMREIVRAVTALAHQLGMQVVAEGIENEGQRALVRSMGCEHAQGFLYSKPVDHEGSASLLRLGFSRPSLRQERRALALSSLA